MKRVDIQISIEISNEIFPVDYIPNQWQISNPYSSYKTSVNVLNGSYRIAAVIQNMTLSSILKTGNHN